MRGQLVRLIVLQIINDNHCTVGLVPVLSKLGPSNFSTVVAKNRGMGGTVFSRGDFLAILTLEIDDKDLGARSVTASKVGSFELTFCLVCQAGGSSGSKVVYTTWVLETSKSSFPPNGSTGEF